MIMPISDPPPPPWPSPSDAAAASVVSGEEEGSPFLGAPSLPWSGLSVARPLAALLFCLASEFGDFLLFLPPLAPLFPEGILPMDPAPSSPAAVVAASVDGVVVVIDVGVAVDTLAVEAALGGSLLSSATTWADRRETANALTLGKVFSKRTCSALLGAGAWQGLLVCMCSLRMHKTVTGQACTSRHANESKASAVQRAPPPLRAMHYSVLPYHACADRRQLLRLVHRR